MLTNLTLLNTIFHGAMSNQKVFFGISEKVQGKFYLDYQGKPHSGLSFC